MIVMGKENEGSQKSAMVLDFMQHKAVSDLVNMSHTGMTVDQFKEKYPDLVIEDRKGWF
jgi:hypothetical protein